MEAQSSNLLFLFAKSKMQQYYQTLLNEIPAHSFNIITASSFDDARNFISTEQIHCIVAENIDSPISLFDFYTQLSDTLEPGTLPVMLIVGEESDLTVNSPLPSEGAIDYLQASKLSAEGFTRAILHAVDKFQLLHTIADQREQIQRIAAKDETTGLSTRRTFESTAKRYVANAQRHKHDLALLLIRFDVHFNSTELTSAVIDAIMQKLAERMVLTLRKGDLLSRFSEFTVAALLTELQESTDTEVICKKLMVAFEKPITIAERKVQVLTRIGIASLDNNISELSDLINHAEIALTSIATSKDNKATHFSSDLL